MDSIDSFTASIGGGFLGDILLGYAMKKVIRIAALLVGLFLAIECILRGNNHRVNHHLLQSSTLKTF